MAEAMRTTSDMSRRQLAWKAWPHCSTCAPSSIVDMQIAHGPVGRGGVEMRWDLTVRTMSSGGSSKTARSTRRPRSASASYGAAGYRIEKQGFVGAVDHRHHRAMM